MTPWIDLIDGWMYFWRTFTHSLWFVLGFVIANAVSTVIYVVLKGVFFMLRDKL